MKLAIISDIHGNSYALDLVLAKIDAEGINRIICLGDTALMGFDPCGSVARLIERNIPTVAGNTEGRILENIPYQPDDAAEASRERDWLTWTIDELGAPERAFLADLPGTLDLEIGGLKITAYHGSPQSYWDPVLPDTPNETLEAWFAGTDAHLLLGGHTHRQMLRRWKGRVIINPGTISLTFERLPFGDWNTRPWAEFAVLTVEDGEIDLSFRYVSVDLAELEHRARASGMPHVEAWLDGWRG